MSVPITSEPVAVLRLFAAAREAAGITSDRFDAVTIGAVLDQAVDRYGPAFAAVLAGSRVWLNGDPATPDQPVTDGDEVAVLPPVSGG
jgi:molybdopterin synthase sulfur carrier subunit